ncbi:MAG: sulfate reduction electron transfer complex DsrMKJOP subunit DsrP, partial [Aeoliella sp.]
GIIRVTILINLLMVISELFTEFYTGGSHISSAQYLFFGLHGHNGLVPWIWTAIGLNIAAAMLFLTPAMLAPSRRWLLFLACAMAFVGAWIEKGMGLIVPGFIPSTLHEIVEYSPSLVEWKVTVGIWAFGMMVFTVALKIAAPTLKSPPTD